MTENMYLISIALVPENSGVSSQVLHSGEGPIHAVKWRTNLIAWANDAGVKVFDSANNQRIAFIERPRGSPLPEILLPHLVWQVS